MTTLPLNTNIALYNGSCYISITPLYVCVDAFIEGQPAQFLLSRSLVLKNGLMAQIEADSVSGRYNEDIDILEALRNGLAQLKGGMEE